MPVSVEETDHFLKQTFIVSSQQRVVRYFLHWINRPGFQSYTGKEKYLNELINIRSNYRLFRNTGKPSDRHQNKELHPTYCF